MTKLVKPKKQKKEVKSFNSKDIFSTPKPERLIERILTLGNNKGDLVLDSFLGVGDYGDG